MRITALFTGKRGEKQKKSLNYFVILRQIITKKTVIKESKFIFTELLMTGSWLGL